MTLIRNGEVLIPNLREAKTPWSRLRGLLGTRRLEIDEGLWISPCNSIHTFFMNYPIDCVFLNRKMAVASLVPGVVPGRVVWPQRGAHSVVELAEGQIGRLRIELGDQLHVGA